MNANKFEEVKPVKIYVSVNDDGNVKISGDALSDMDRRYGVGDKIYLSVRGKELWFESYRGNLQGEWENVTSDWNTYSILLSKGKLHENLERIMKENEQEDKAKGDTVNTDISSIPDGQGMKELRKKANAADCARKGVSAVKALNNAIQSNSSGVRISEDADIQKLKKYQADSIYQSIENNDGSYTIAKSQNGGKHRYELRVRGEFNSSTFTTSVKVYLVDICSDIGRENVAACKSISTRSIRLGGTALVNLILDYGNLFTMSEANYANARLFVLIMQGKLSMQNVDPYFSFSETVDWFKDYIIKAVEERASNIDNKAFWHPEVYLEKINKGPRSNSDKESHIVVGIWQTNFKQLYKELVEEGRACVKEAEFLRQAKQQSVLLPDAGRGGGQHTPGEPTCLRYGHTSVERIQRFNLAESISEDLWNKEVKFREVTSADTYY